MKTAKSNKIITFLLLLVVALAFAFIGMQTVGVSAESSPISAGAYFDYSAGERAETEITFENDNVLIPLDSDDKIKFLSKLAVDDFEISVKVPTGVDKFTLLVTAPSFYANGNAKVDGEGKTTYETNIVNELIVNANGTATFNGGAQATISSTDGVYTVKLGKASNFLTATVNGTAVPSSNADEYKVEDNGRIIAIVEMGVTLTDGVTEAVKLELISVDQKTTDGTGAYKQLFVLNTEKTAIANTAKPVIKLNDSFMKLDGDNIIVNAGVIKTLDIAQYAVIKNNKTFSLVSSDESVWTGTDSYYIKFNQTGNKTFSVVDRGDNSIVYETFNVLVTTELKDGAGNKPVYNLDETARKAFEQAVINKTIDSYDKEGNPIYVRIGGSQQLELPSLKNIISDDITSYENLTFTVHYKTPSTESTSSNLKIPLTEAGKYEFFITAKDEMGNEIQTGDFYTTDKDGDRVLGVYSDYIFSFTVLDNAPITVTPAMSQGEGYIGVLYTATGFTISATSYEVEYTLLYSKTADAPEDEWVAIPQASEVTDKTYNKDGFTYDNIQSINYDGNLAFTPDRAGYYKLVCTITSTTSSRVNETATSTPITVQKKPQVVYTAENDWLANNVWSVVFLSVGSVCLIAIIALLFVKPKDVANTRAPRERTKSRRRK